MLWCGTASDIVPVSAFFEKERTVSISSEGKALRGRLLSVACAVGMAMAASPSSADWNAGCCGQWLSIPGTGTFSRDFNCAQFLKSAREDQVKAVCRQIASVPDDKCPEKKLCGQQKCGPAEKSHTPGDDVDKLVGFMKKQLNAALTKLQQQAAQLKDSDPEKVALRGKMDKVKQALGYWDQIAAASCVPDDVMQATSGFLGGTVNCPMLCANLKRWYERLIGQPDSAQGKLFYETCLADCNEP
jgi:hypothetical protein